MFNQVRSDKFGDDITCITEGNNLIDEDEIISEVKK